MRDDSLKIADRSFSSRLLIGTGKFPSAQALRDAIAGSRAEIVTVALRRVDLDNPDEEGILSAVDQSQQLLLPNTSGARNAEEAVRLARDAIRRQSSALDGVVALAAALGYLGRAEEARTAIQGHEGAAPSFVEGSTVSELT